MGKEGIAIIMDVYTKGRLRITKPMGWVYITTLFRDISTTVNGKMMFRMEKVRKNSKMGHTTKEISFMASNQELVTMSVTLAYMKENSQTAISMEMAYSLM